MKRYFGVGVIVAAVLNVAIVSAQWCGDAGDVAGDQAVEVCTSSVDCFPLLTAWVCFERPVCTWECR